MTLRSAIEAELPFLRAQAESLMTDTFSAHRPDPTGTTTNADGFEVPAYVPEGPTPGKMQARGAGLGAGNDTAVRYVKVGGIDRPVLEGGLHIPISAPVPVAGDRGIGWEYRCDAIGDMSDPVLLGRRWLVVGVPAKTHSTARRLDVVEVS